MIQGHNELILSVLYYIIGFSERGNNLLALQMPFRTAHGKAGEVTKLSEDLGCPFSRIPLEQLTKIRCDIISFYDSSLCSGFINYHILYYLEKNVWFCLIKKTWSTV